MHALILPTTAQNRILPLNPGEAPSTLPRWGKSNRLPRAYPWLNEGQSLARISALRSYNASLAALSPPADQKKPLRRLPWPQAEGAHTRVHRRSAKERFDADCQRCKLCATIRTRAKYNRLSPIRQIHLRQTGHTHSFAVAVLQSASHFGPKSMPFPALCLPTRSPFRGRLHGNLRPVEIEICPP